jgi:thymidylate kinase
VVGRGRRLRLARGSCRRAPRAGRRSPALRVRTVSNQGRFYPGFDAVVLLSAPLEVLLGRIEHRTTNDFGKTPADHERLRSDFAAFEHRLRATCTHELDATQPIDDIVAELIQIGDG